MKLKVLKRMGIHALLFLCGFVIPCVAGVLGAIYYPKILAILVSVVVVAVLLALWYCVASDEIDGENK